MARWLVAVLVAAVVLAASCAPAPSEPPTARESLPAGPNAGLLELTARIRAGGPQRAAIIQSLAEASAGDPLELVPSAAALVRWAEAELAWLDEHPPQPCYEPAHAAYGDALAAFASAGTAFAEVAEAGGPVDVLGLEAAEALGEANDAMMAAEVAAIGAGGACS